MANFLRPLLIACGFISVFLGIIGIFFPVLPTTPFLLLAAFCFARSSDRFLNWLQTNRWLGAYIRNYREGRGMPLREKILTLAALWLSITLTAFLVISAWWVRILLFAIAAGVTIHLVRIKTYRPDSAARNMLESDQLQMDQSINSDR